MKETHLFLRTFLLAASKIIHRDNCLERHDIAISDLKLVFTHLLNLLSLLRDKVSRAVVGRSIFHHQLDICEEHLSAFVLIPLRPVLHIA